MYAIEDVERFFAEERECVCFILEMTMDVVKREGGVHESITWDRRIEQISIFT